MFHATDLSADDDRGPLGHIHAVFVTDKQSDRFLQPCPAVHDGRCTIHALRPAMCRAYACDLLTGVEQGTVDRDEATAVIGRALALRDRVRPALEELTARPPVPAPMSLTPAATPVDPDGSAPAFEPARRINQRSIPGLRNALTERVGATERAALPVGVRVALDDADELLGLLRDRFGLGR
jgi:hypothetical protein